MGFRDRFMGGCVVESSQKVGPASGGLFSSVFFGIRSRVWNTVFGVSDLTRFNGIDPVGDMVDGIDERVCCFCLLCVLGYGLSSPFVFYKSLSIPRDAGGTDRMDQHSDFWGLVLGAVLHV